MTVMRGMLVVLVVLSPTRRSWAEETEPAIAGEGVEADFLRAAHARVHRRWADNFVAMAAAQLPRGHAVNDPGRRVSIEITVSRDGKVLASRIESGSGAPEFDAAALEVLATSVPFPAPPEDALSDDGQAHLQWVFARDQRRCAELKVVQKESPLELAVPRLLEQKRDREAVRRVGAAAADPAVGIFARAWLKRALGHKETAFAAAVALAGAGEPAGIELLREAVKKNGDLGAARALSMLRAPLCPLVKPMLLQSQSRARALGILRTGADGECVTALLDLARDGRVPAGERALAIEGLGGVGEENIKREIAKLAKEASPEVQVAALVAMGRSGARRAALFGLAPFLRDKSVVVRGMAAAGLVRVAGDDALPQLYLLFKETDARPYELVAAELKGLPSVPSAEILARFLRKDDRRIRVAAAAALAARNDEPARKALAPLLKERDPELRFYAAGAAAAGERSALVTAVGPSGRTAYRALASGSGRPTAAAWLLSQLDRLGGVARAEALGDWLATTRSGAPVASESATP